MEQNGSDFYQASGISKTRFPTYFEHLKNLRLSKQNEMKQNETKTKFLPNLQNFPAQ